MRKLTIFRLIRERAFSRKQRFYSDCLLKTTIGHSKKKRKIDPAFSFNNNDNKSPQKHTPFKPPTNYIDNSNNNNNAANANANANNNNTTATANNANGNNKNNNNNNNINHANDEEDAEDDCKVRSYAQ